MSASASKDTNTFSTWLKREDTWAIFIAIGLISFMSLAYFTGNISFFKTMSVKIPTWLNEPAKVLGGLQQNATGIMYLLAVFALVFTAAAKVLDYRVGKFAAGFSVLFIISLIVTILGSNTFLKTWQMETPLIALLLGMLISNTMKLPAWFQSALRTEFYIKTGIVLMGATLPFTIIMQAGPLAILQATIVAATTFFAIYFAATKLFGLDPRFGATLGAGGSICGVSAAIAIGGACRAKKEHVSVAISLVIIWAIAMIFTLPWAAKTLGLAAGPAGAWIGTSEFADAAGFAAAEAFGNELAVKAFTLMKVVGRDMFVGIWALLAAFMSVTVWEKSKSGTAERVDFAEIWRRFPKFVLGFFAASILMTVIIANLDPKAGANFTKEVLGPIKDLRGWTFTWAFLSIGFTTRFRELASFGWKPLAAFAAGVLVNVPLGYWLSNVVFVNYWLQLK